MNWQLAVCVLICGFAFVGLARRFRDFVMNAETAGSGCYARCSNCDASENRVFGNKVVVEIEQPDWRFNSID